MRISEFELVNHGIQHTQFFRGCGTAFTRFDHCVTGIGNSPAEAIDNCLEWFAQNGLDVDGMEQRILDQEGIESLPSAPTCQKSTADVYHHVSIRWNEEEEGD